MELEKGPSLEKGRSGLICPKVITEMMVEAL